MLLAWAIAAALPSASANAQSADGLCASATSDLGGTLGVARIAGARARVHFVRDRDKERPACPDASATCREKAFLVARDVVVTQPSTVPGFVCSTFANARGHETSGWLPADALEPLAPRPVTTASYAGRWHRTEAIITIRPGKGAGLQVDGEATWGARDPGRVARGGVNTGELGGIGRFVGNTVLVAEDGVKTFAAAPDTSCTVQMRLVASYLLVQDNGACGGANVSFTGVYVRR